MNEGGFLWFLVFVGVIGWVVYLNVGTVACRAGNIGQAAQAQSVCQPAELRLPRKPD